jgi:hypothetical protein
MCEKLHLRLDEQVLTSHLLGLLDAHSSQNSRRNVTQDTALLEAPALRSVGHNKWNLVESVGGLRSALLVEHLLGISFIGC